MFEKFLKILKNKEVLKRLLQIFLLLIVFRILAHIPLPGIDIANLKTLLSGNQLLGVINLLSGSGMTNFSIVALGVGPYITASIIIQLLIVIVPKLEKLSQEGEAGQGKINRYTRYLTLPFAILQGYSILALLNNSGMKIVANLGITNIVFMVALLTAGSMLLMWIGEIISEKKLGNGMSWIIFSGIIAGFLSSIQQTLVTYDSSQILNILVYVVLALATIFGVVFITEAQRNLPVIYARQFKAGKENLGTSAGAMSYLPIRVNQVGMIPIIFAVSIVTIPSILSQVLVNIHSQNMFYNYLYKGVMFLNDKTVYAVFYFVMVILFTYFYTSLVFKADKISENLNKQGAYIPGIRPGKETENHLNFVSSRIVLAGALFLGAVAVLPLISQAVFGVQNMMIGGASLLIVIGTIIETMKQLEAYHVQNDYEGKYADYNLVK